MPGPMTLPPPPKPATTQFNANTPGGGAQLSGINSGLQNLQNALKLSGNTTQAGQMQLGQQLQQNQAGIAQNMASRGLGNSSISQTMAQAPLQTYNLGMAQLGDLGAMRGMSAFGNLANAQMQGGNQVSQLAQPYAQTDFTQQKMQQMGQQQQVQQAASGKSPNGGVNGMDPFGYGAQQAKMFSQENAPQWMYQNLMNAVGAV